MTYITFCRFGRSITSIVGEVISVCATCCPTATTVKNVHRTDSHEPNPSVTDNNCVSLSSLFCVIIPEFLQDFLCHSTLWLFLNQYTCPRADGAKRRARVLIPPGYLHPGKRKH
jgi:hypothetical protein